MVRKNFRYLKAIVLLGAMFSLCGCGMAKVSSRILPDTDITKYEIYYVVRHSEEEHNMDEIIQREMQVLGLNVQSGPLKLKPSDVDVIVTYEDNWAWDITSYLLSLAIDFRDAESDKLLATGKSYRPSMDRKPPDFMTREILDGIFKKK